MLVSGVSTLGQSLSQVDRLRSIQGQFDDLQRQLTTGKKFDSLKGLQNDVVPSLRFREQVNQIEVFQRNITQGNIRLDQMTNALNQMRELSRNILGALDIQTFEGELDLGVIQQQAQNSMDFFQELMNTDDNGRRLFAGGEVATDPYVNDTALINNISTELSDWLDGTNTGATFLTNIDALSETQLGYANTLAASGPVRLRIDEGFEIDYTLRANDQAFQDILVGIEVLSQISFPDPNAGDVATEADFHVIINDIHNRILRGVQQLDQQSIRFEFLKTQVAEAEQRHNQDTLRLQNFISDLEDVDLTETVAKIQTLEIQLDASFRTTALINQLSLVNFL